MPNDLIRACRRSNSDRSGPGYRTTTWSTPHCAASVRLSSDNGVSTDASFIVRVTNRRGRSEDDQAASLLAGGERPERLVGLVDVVPLRDELRDLDPPCHRQLDQFREGDQRVARAVARTHDAALAPHEQPWIDRERGAGLREAEHDLDA